MYLCDPDGLFTVRLVINFECPTATVPSDRGCVDAVPRLGMSDPSECIQGILDKAMLKGVFQDWRYRDQVRVLWCVTNPE
jgi:hypothetical protein